MRNRDIVVIGASAGGVEGVQQLLSGLPADLPASVFVVIHTAPMSPGLLPRLFERAGALRSPPLEDGLAIEPGVVYAAPPDLHLLVKRGRLRLVRGPRENGHRPAVDPLFRSAARLYGRRVIGVILSGNLDDGTAGLRAVKANGGVSIVQDPADALFPGMPTSAVENVDVDYTVPLSEIGPLIARLVAEPIDGGGAMSKADRTDAGAEEAGDVVDEVELSEREFEQHAHAGEASGYTCPECHGALWEATDESQVRYRCRVGHAYSSETLAHDQRSMIEAALWTALRALDESAALTGRLIERARRANSTRAESRFTEQLENLRARSLLLRQVLQSSGPLQLEEVADWAPATQSSSGAGTGGGGAASGSAVGTTAA